MQAVDKLDKAIAEVEAKLAKLRAVRDALDDPDVAAVFAGQNGSKRTGTLFERIADFFAERGNEWATIDQIRKAVGNPLNSVRQLLYKGKPDAFERQRHDGGATLFRLRSEEEAQ